MLGYWLHESFRVHYTHPTSDWLPRLLSAAASSTKDEAIRLRLKLVDAGMAGDFKSQLQAFQTLIVLGAVVGSDPAHNSVVEAIGALNQQLLKNTRSNTRSREQELGAISELEAENGRLQQEITRLRVQMAAQATSFKLRLAELEKGPIMARTTSYPFNPNRFAVDDLHVRVHMPCIGISEASTDSFGPGALTSTENGLDCDIEFEGGQVEPGQSTELTIVTLDHREGEVTGYSWTLGGVKVGEKFSSDDTDEDGLPDWYEKFVTGTDPNDQKTGYDGADEANAPTDASQDPDNDGLDNDDEYNKGTDPMNPDTDGDEWDDKEDQYPRDPDY